jgi:hypothetical protein
VRPDPAAFLDAAWSEVERQATLVYLDRGAVCARFHAYATCGTGFSNDM